MVGTHLIKAVMRLKYILILVVLTTLAFATSAQPVISEFMVQNNTVLADEDGAFSDWIEIYNPGLRRNKPGGFTSPTTPAI